MERLEKKARELVALLKATDDMFGCVTAQNIWEKVESAIVLVELAKNTAIEMEDLIETASSIREGVE